MRNKERIGRLANRVATIDRDIDIQLDRVNARIDNLNRAKVMREIMAQRYGHSVEVDPDENVARCDRYAYTTKCQCGFTYGTDLYSVEVVALEEAETARRLHLEGRI